MAIKRMQMYRRNLDGTETRLNPLTEAQYVSMENGQTVQEILSDRDSDKYTPVITNSSSTFKVGQGDNVDLSSSMKEGAYDSCVLKGKTMVNSIQEPSRQDVVLPYAFENGQYVTINDTKESGALSVELKGQTLVNLATKTRAMGLQPQFDGDTITLTSTTNGAWYSTTLRTVGMKAGGTYLLYTDSITYDDSLSSSPHLKSIVSLYEMIPNRNLGRFVSNGAIRVTIPSDVDGSDIGLRIHATLQEGTEGTGKTTTVKGLRIIEYQEGMENWDIPYFEGMTSCKMPILHTVGKNLFDGEIELGTINVNSGEVGSTTTEIRSKNFTPINGTPFVFSRTDSTGSLAMRYYDVNKNYLGTGDGGMREGQTSRICTPPTNARYVKFKDMTTNLSQKVQIEYNTSATTYEDHKSSILSLPEEVVLRNIGSVKDTLNLNTGDYIQRIGEVVLDGSEDEKWTLHQISSYTTHTRFEFSLRSNNKPLGIVHTELKCDRFTWINGDVETEHIKIDGGNARSIFLYIQNSKLATQDVGGLRAWLSQNPTIIQYQLETPIVTKINLPSTLKSWNTTTHIYSEIPENTLYPILSHSNPTYPVILKPSTKYSIVANSYSNSHTNSPINFNLGGATTSTTVGNRVTTITTPSTLSNELLTMNGRGNKLNNVMVIEGDVVGDEPYFEGICDCKAPILSNVGKNLFDERKVILNKYQNHNTSNGNFSISTNTNYKITDFIRVKPNTKYDNQIGNGAYYNIDKKPLTNHFCGISIITTPSDAHYVVLNMGVNEDTSTAYFIEAPQRVTHEPYKSNILSCNGDKIELTRDMLEQGSYDGDPSLTYEQTKSNNTKRLRTKTYIRVKPNTTYRITSSLFKFNHREYESSGFTNGVKSEWTNELLFTTQTTTQYITLLLKDTNNDNKVLTADLFNNDDVVIREVDKTIVLRSLPNGVCDTLNVETGEYVQRIGEVTKNNSTGFGLSSGGWENKSDVCTFEQFKPEGMKVQLANNKPTLNCDKVPSNTFSTQWNNSKGIESITQHNGGNIVLSITRDKLLTQDVNGLNTYLQSNPLTIQYELATPIVSTIDVQGFPYAYTNGHVQLSSGHSGQSLTPKVEYSLSANKTGQINSNTRQVVRQQNKLDDFEAMMLTSLVESAYDKAILQFDYEMQMMSLGGE